MKYIILSNNEDPLLLGSLRLFGCFVVLGILFTVFVWDSPNGTHSTTNKEKKQRATNRMKEKEKIWDLR